MDSKVIAALIGLAGISLGAFLGGIGYYLKTRAERTKVKKLVLYHLLEIRHFIKVSATNPNAIAQEYFKLCNKYFKSKGFSDENEIPKEIVKLISGHLQNLFIAQKPKITKEFIELYENSLVELCKDEPVLAYMLKGKENISHLLEAQSLYIENFSEIEMFSSTAELKAFFSKEIDDANFSAISSLIEDLDNEITTVAKKCGIITRLECRKVIRNGISQEVSLDEKELTAAFDKLFQNALDAAAKK
ncbi:hypothetical protein [Thalassotalea montiporae]